MTRVFGAPRRAGSLTRPLQKNKNKKCNRIEFQEHALSDIITVKHRDVYKDGFELENQVDASEGGLRSTPEAARQLTLCLPKFSSTSPRHGKHSSTQRRLCE